MIYYAYPQCKIQLLVLTLIPTFPKIVLRCRVHCEILERRVNLCHVEMISLKQERVEDLQDLDGAARPQHVQQPIQEEDVVSKFLGAS